MKSFHQTLLCGLLLAGALLAPPAHAADGKGVFMTECAECHSAAQGKNKKGPSMFGVGGGGPPPPPPQKQKKKKLKHASINKKKKIPTKKISFYI
ncbi:c-type cytochrome, partial [Xanthomonas arboricola pv. pruni]|uniref:c-type cytochrome n=1 Tax=Xanthomonas arboricola TaxID=56448 RepID=UPI003B85D036